MEGCTAGIAVHGATGDYKTSNPEALLVRTPPGPGFMDAAPLRTVAVFTNKEGFFQVARIDRPALYRFQ
jgi:hypothetical protein